MKVDPVLYVAAKGPTADDELAHILKCKPWDVWSGKPAYAKHLLKQHRVRISVQTLPLHYFISQLGLAPVTSKEQMLARTAAGLIVDGLKARGLADEELSQTIKAPCPEFYTRWTLASARSKDMQKECHAVLTHLRERKALGFRSTPAERARCELTLMARTELRGFYWHFGLAAFDCFEHELGGKWPVSHALFAGAEGFLVTGNDLTMNKARRVLGKKNMQPTDPLFVIRFLLSDSCLPVNGKATRLQRRCRKLLLERIGLAFPLSTIGGIRTLMYELQLDSRKRKKLLQSGDAALDQSRRSHHFHEAEEEERDLICHR